MKHSAVSHTTHVSTASCEKKCEISGLGENKSTILKMYNSWKVHGTIPTYWFEKDPLLNLPFGICAIYFELKVSPIKNGGFFF